MGSRTMVQNHSEVSVIETAYQELSELSPLSKRMEIAGSIRRMKANPNDVDIVLIPKNIESIMKYISQYSAGNIGRGSHHASYKKDGVEVELYFATEQNLGAMLMYATGTNQYNIMMRIYAKFKGMKLSQKGLFKDGKMIAGRTEQEIYNALGKRWKEPSERGLFVEK
jgi:DNA polymerase (family 10)